jgi:hypothetical protein
MLKRHLREAQLQDDLDAVVAINKRLENDLTALYVEKVRVQDDYADYRRRTSLRDGYAIVQA